METLVTTVMPMCSFYFLSQLIYGVPHIKRWTWLFLL